MLTTATGEDVEDGELKESHPLGWCAAGDHSHCPLWVQCGHFNVSYVFSVYIYIQFSA